MNKETVLNNRNVSDLFLLLMTINSMLGAGVFLNAKPLSLLAGKMAFLSYLIGAIVILPVVLMLAGLAQAKPVAGGMYTYVKDVLGTNVGFFSAWAYFLAKIVSIAILVQAFCLPFKSLLVGTILENSLALELFTMMILATLNIIGVRLYGYVQWLFSAIKLLPILTFAGLGIAIFYRSKFQVLAEFASAENIVASFPVAIFAISGFEITSTMAHTVKNPENIRQTAFKAFLIVIGAYLTFQLGAQLVAGPALATATPPLNFLASSASVYLGVLGFVAGLCMRIAALTIAFSILANNCWNLVAIAKDQLLPFASHLSRINRHNVPWVAIVVEIIIAWIIMKMSSEQVALQNMSVLAISINFLVISFAAIIYWFKNHDLGELILGLISLSACLLVLLLSAQNVFKAGLSVPFLGLFALGVIVAVLYRRNKGCLRQDGC